VNKKQEGSHNGAVQHETQRDLVAGHDPVDNSEQQGDVEEGNGKVQQAPMEEAVDGLREVIVQCIEDMRQQGGC
jgi:hypothetical protein